MKPPDCPVCRSTRTTRYRTPYPDPLFRCRKCGTRFVHPPPTEAELRSRYAAEHEAGKWASLFDGADPKDPVRRARLLDHLSRARAGRRLLDVGCGDGRFMDAARTLGWDPVGLELSAAALSRTRGRHAVAVGTLAALRPGPRFAAITFWDVLEHLPDPADALQAAAQVLAPGGFVAVSMPNAGGTEALLAGRRWRYHDVGTYGHLVHLGVAQLERLMRGAGLDPVHVETRGSVDLRDLMGGRAPGAAGDALRWAADRASGVLARFAEPRRRGNTLVVVARAATRVSR